MHGLLCDAASLLKKEWGTGTLAPLDMCASMALVHLPHFRIVPGEHCVCLRQVVRMPCFSVLVFCACLFIGCPNCATCSDKLHVKTSLSCMQACAFVADSHKFKIP